MAAGILRALGTLPGGRALTRRRMGAPDRCLETEALGVTFTSPLGAAAGLDKNATLFSGLSALGFGFVEVGTVTARPQPGNCRPRVHRLPADRALINNMGFPNRGAAAAARRLRRPRDTLVAVNIGRSRAAEDAVCDYRQSTRQLASHADLLVVNVSSPNTPGLRDMQAVPALTRLVAEIRSELGALAPPIPPLLVKISPDLSNGEIDGIARAALALQLDGIVAVNTTTSRSGLMSETRLTERPGGLSGPPLKARSLEVLRRLRAVTGGKLVLVSVGGIESDADAWERINAGATLVQAYTGFVYGGPLWPSRVNRKLAARVRAAGAASIGELVGRQADDRHPVIEPD